MDINCSLIESTLKIDRVQTQKLIVAKDLPILTIMKIMILPPKLRSTGTISIVLLGGKTIDLPTCHPTFQKWEGLFTGFDFGKKPLINHANKPVFAELAILQILLENGWDGVWVETYGGINFLREMPSNWKLYPHNVEIPNEKRDIVSYIQKTVGTKACFDVFAWKGKDILFCEAKHKNKDSFTGGQLKFIEGALSCGIPRTSLLIAEWEYI